MPPAVEVRFSRPHRALRPHVERYVGYRMEGFPPGIHRGLPSRHLTFIVSLGTPIDVTAMPDGSQQAGSYDAVVAGMQAAPAVMAHHGDQTGIAVEMGPMAARALFGLPAAAIASTVLDLTDVLGSRAAELPERLAAVDTWPERFTILDRALLEAVQDRSRPPADVAWAWQRLTATGGAVRVGALAEERGWSRRHFTDRFGREVGVSPKVAARVLRFDHARQVLTAGHGLTLATVAARCGYADQAHLTREWRQLAGCSPTEWLGEELPFVQDTSEAPAAG